jgi:hypothetical protein
MSIQEIAKIWDYKATAPFYQVKLPQILVNAKLWKIERYENRKLEYLSIFDGYFDFLKICSKDELVKLIIEDKEIFLKFFKEYFEANRDLFKLEYVKEFFKNDVGIAQKLGFSLPITLLSQILVLIWIIKKYNWKDEEIKEYCSPFFHMFSGISPYVNIAEYNEKIFQYIKFEELRKWDYLLDTKFGKHITNEINKRSKLIDLLFKIKRK